MYQEFLAYWQPVESMPRAGISAPSLAWRILAHRGACTALIPRLCHTRSAIHFSRIKRKTHGRTWARESSCRVRPFLQEGGDRRRPKGVVARECRCVRCLDLIKGPFATDGWLFAGDFVKDFSVVDGPGSARSRHRRLLVLLSLRGQPRPIYFRLCSYWSTEISFRLRVISTGAKQVRLTYGDCKSPFCVSVRSAPHSVFTFSIFRMKDTFIILGSNRVRRAARYSYDQ